MRWYDHERILYDKMLPKPIYEWIWLQTANSYNTNIKTNPYEATNTYNTEYI